MKLKTGCDDSQIYVFDMEHEQKRREQLEKLFNRTKEQVDEELYLIEELKKIEVRKKEREKKQQEVDKLLTAAGDLENTATTATSSSSLLLKNRTSISQKSRSSSSRSKKQKSRENRAALNASWSQSNGGTGGLDASTNSLNNSADGSSLNQSGSPSGLITDKKGSAIKV